MKTACDVQVHPKSKNFSTWERAGALPYARSQIPVAKFELKP